MKETVESASAVLDARIRELKDWRGKTLAKVREIIHAADPEIVEEWKWVKATSPGVPVWSHGGMICTGETYKDHVKMTFAKGAALKDPAGLFNSSLEGNVRRAIDIQEGDKIDEAALKNLIREAVALNLKGKREQTQAETPMNIPRLNVANNEKFVIEHSFYLHSTRLSCEAMICHVSPRFSHVSVQTWHTFALGCDWSLPTACSRP